MGCPKRSEAPLCRLVGIGLWGSVCGLVDRSVCGLVDRSVYGQVGSNVYRLVGRGPVGWGPYQELIHRQILRGRCDRMRYFVSGWNFRVCLFEILASRR